MPPPGGYRKFNYGRTFPKLVWRPSVVVAAVFGASVYGAFDAIAKKKARVTEKFEDVDITNAMQPFLTAERDRYWLKLLKKNRELEEEVMKDVPGWKTGELTEKFEDVDITNAMQPFLTAERDRYWLKLLKKNRELEEEVMKDVPGWKTGTWYGEPVYFTLGDKWWDPMQDEVFAHSKRDVFYKEHLWRHHSEYAAPKFYDKWIPDFIMKYCW
ncbi:unnamed protein product [Strongylus vulgaris]|uniref:NADH dehydrogenase [ubiquinone] 1 alpha subcomplex subunit 13 n=1 Tax=Strongylus vulgaris TaxID=40348 RepID=A0A3P7JL49_STRVU|nr:unnamed protein product [Strongylus vulgaris]